MRDLFSTRRRSAGRSEVCCRPPAHEYFRSYVSMAGARHLPQATSEMRATEALANRQGHPPLDEPCFQLVRPKKNARRAAGSQSRQSCNLTTTFVVNRRGKWARIRRNTLESGSEFQV